MSSNDIKKLEPEDAHQIFPCADVAFIASKNIAMINFLKTMIKDIEKEVLSKCRMKEEYSMLLTIPGIGKILALTIMLEVGDILRFPKAGNYVSYSRCADSKKISNGKKKGVNNKKNGNKYLAWAYVEAANFAIRYCPHAKKFYQRKAAKNNQTLAIKALSSKVCRASYYVMRDQVPYDVARVFS
jgi:transposase